MCTVHIRFPWPETKRRKRISSSAPTGVNAKSFSKGSVGQRAQGKSKRAGVLKPENKMSGGGGEFMNGKHVFSENELRESRHGEVTHRCSASCRPACSRRSSGSTRPATPPRAGSTALILLWNDGHLLQAAPLHTCGARSSSQLRETRPRDRQEVSANGP